MTTMTAGAGLIAAYRNTDYQVILDGHRLSTRIGAANAALDALLSAETARGGLFITAWNPFSRIAPPAANQAAHQELAALVAAAGYRALAHQGVGEDQAWLPEEGLFVLDMTVNDGLTLARQFRQNAIMAYEAAVGGRLILLDWSITWSGSRNRRPL